MELNANCKKCGAPWRLIAGVDSIPEDDPIVHECPHCDINCRLNGWLNATKTIVESIKRIGGIMARNADAIIKAAESFKVKP